MHKKLHLLVVDDDNDFARDFAVLSRDVFDLSFAATGEEALNSIEQAEPDAVVLDLRLGAGLDGLQTLRCIRTHHCDLPVIMVTDHASWETAVEAMKLGALHYTSKHPNMKELHAIIQRELRSVTWKSLCLEQIHQQYGEMIGDSPAMKKIHEVIAHVASTSAPVLIEGENGTGKELVAREIHARSKCAPFPFIAVNCGAIPASLFESEMFGHEKGAFTGAIARKPGKFEMADDSTIFLDEISNLSLELQAKLLRVLDDQTFTRVGGNTPIQVNARIISASNKNLEEEVAAGRFRQDLYYRLKVVKIDLPPLRERKEDIPLLAAYFARRTALKYGRRCQPFSPAALKVLESHRWPGNIRELRNVIESALIMASDRPIQPADLSLSHRASEKDSPFADVLTQPYDQAKNRLLSKFKKAYLSALMERHQNNITAAAKEANLPRTSLHRMLKEED